MNRLIDKSIHAATFQKFDRKRQEHFISVSKYTVLLRYLNKKCESSVMSCNAKMVPNKSRFTFTLSEAWHSVLSLWCNWDLPTKLQTPSLFPNPLPHAFFHLKTITLIV